MGASGAAGVPGRGGRDGQKGQKGEAGRDGTGLIFFILITDYIFDSVDIIS